MASDNSEHGINHRPHNARGSLSHGHNRFSVCHRFLNAIIRRVAAAAPRKHEIVGRFVDRFVTPRVLSRVSRRWFSPRGAPLSSGGSRRARFPAIRGTTKALRLPVRAFPVPYGFGSGLHVPLRIRARRSAPDAAEDRCRAWGVDQPVSPSGRLPMGTHWISQVSWRSVPYLCPVLRPRPDQHTLATCGCAGAAPVPTLRRLQQEHDFGA